MLASATKEPNGRDEQGRGFRLQRRTILFAGILLIVLGALVLDVFFMTGLYGSDDAGYLEVAQKILHESFPISPCNDKVAELRMGMALPAAFFLTLNNDDAQLASAGFILFHLLLVVLTWRLGARAHNKRVGLIAALLVATCPLLVVCAGSVLPDLPSTMFLVAALSVVWMPAQTGADPPPSLWRRVFGGFLFGCAFSAKESALVFLPFLMLAACSSSGLPSLRRRLAGAAAMLAGLALAVGLESALIFLIHGDWMIRPLAPLPPHVYVTMKALAAQQGGNNPLARAQAFVSLITPMLGGFGPLLLLGAVAYPLLKNRSWLLWGAMVWLLIYNVCGSIAVDRYIPVLMQARYFTVVIPFAAIFSAAVLDRAIDYLRPILRSRLRGRIAISAAAALALLFFGNALLLDNLHAGNLYEGKEVGPVSQAMDFALLNYKEPIVLSRMLSEDFRPMFYYQKDRRIQLTTNEGFDFKAFQKLTVNQGCLFICTQLDRAWPPNKPGLLMIRRRQLTFLDRFNLDTNVFLGLPNALGPLTITPLGKFFPYTDRLSALLWHFNWRAGLERPHAQRYAAFVYYVKFPPAVASPASGPVPPNRAAPRKEVTLVKDPDFNPWPDNRSSHWLKTGVERTSTTRAGHPVIRFIIPTHKGGSLEQELIGDPLMRSGDEIQARAWIRANEPGKASLVLVLNHTDAAGKESHNIILARHPGDGQWHLLEVRWQPTLGTVPFLSQIGLQIHADPGGTKPIEVSGPVQAILTHQNVAMPPQ